MAQAGNDDDDDDYDNDSICLRHNSSLIKLIVSEFTLYRNNSV
jgi:hypothetical protein